MATQNNYGAQSQRETTTSHEREPSSTPQESEQARETQAGGQSVDFCQRFSKSIEELLVTCRNEDFRDQCFKILGVENGYDAGVKTRELAMKLKDKRQKGKKGKKKK